MKFLLLTVLAATTIAPQARLCPNYTHKSSKCESKLNNALLFHPQPHHGNMVASQGMFEQLGLDNNFNVVRIDDGNTSNFTANGLKDFDVVIFNGGCEMGQWLSSNEQLAFQDWYESGKGFLAVHCACWPRSSWPWFGELFGNNLQDTYRAHENPATVATVNLDPEGANHESALNGNAKMESITRNEEFYIYTGSPRGLDGVEITYVLDPDSRSATGVNFTGVAEAEMSWYREYLGGRSYWTYWGHESAAFQNEEMKSHWLGGIQMAAGYDIVGCMDTTNPEYDPNATKSNPAACATAIIQPNVNSSIGVLVKKSKLSISIRGIEIHNVSIYNMSGDKLISENGIGEKIYNFESFVNPGLYLVEVKMPSRIESKMVTIF